MDLDSTDHTLKPTQPSRTFGAQFTRIGLLILAGEAIFLLPFVLPRIFRPTVLAVFEMDNTALGSCFSLYGIVALISYLFGGPIADVLAPRKLMAIALLLTAAGGLVISTYPSVVVMRWVYGYWGFTTIFLFWAALLKATRQWGGATNQGKAFGFLDGGRGLVSAVMGSCLVALFSTASPELEKGVDLTLLQQREAFRNVILITSATVAITGLLVWFFLKTETDSFEQNSDTPRRKLNMQDVLSALALPSVWLLMAIVLCGYVGYKVTDDLSLYAKEVMQFDDVQAAWLGTLLLYVRPVVGVAAGFLADWSRSATWLIAGFLSSLVGAIVIGSGVIAPTTLVVFYFAMFATCIGVYAIRSLYFAAMQEGEIPLAVTGTAVGLISVVGYTPDIFMGPVMGYLLDGSPGEAGHRQLFWLLAAFSVVGFLATLAFRILTRRTATS